MERTAAFANQFTVPIYRIDERDIPDHLATAILVEHEGTRYLVTAAHVFDDGCNNLYLITGNGPVAIVGDVHSTGDRSNRKFDKIDVAILKLAESTVQNLNGVIFLPSIDLDQQPIVYQERDYYVAFGYPNSKQQKRDTVRHKVIQNPVRIGCLAADPARFAKTGAVPGKSLVIKYFRKKLVHSNDRVQPGPSLRGMSGGGVWGAGTLSQIRNTLSVGWKPRLSGMIIEFHPPENAILVTQSCVIMGLIRGFQTD